jgi:hypothetical protein
MTQRTPTQAPTADSGPYRRLSKGEQPLQEPVGSSAILWGTVGLASLIAFVVVIVIIFTSVPPPAPGPSTQQKLGGIYNDTASDYFVDSYEVGLVATIMQTLTNQCSPPIQPIPSPIYNLITPTGSYATTTASWQAFMGAVNGTGPGDCIFYGLLETQVRTGVLVGVCDLCQAYMIAGLQYFIANPTLTPAQLNDLPVMIQTAVLSSFPLTMYFQRNLALGANWAGTITNQLLPIFSAFATHAAGSRDVQQIAVSVCNAFFATDQPNTYFNEALQSHLAFPWEGMINKRAKTVMTHTLQTMLGGLVVPPDLGIKHVYIIDPGGSFPNNLGSNAAVQNFLAAQIPAGTPITALAAAPRDALSQIVDTIYNGGTVIDQTLIPVLVVGRYVDDAQGYQSFQIEPNTVMFAMSPNDPFGELRGADLGTLLQNAAASGSMSVFDFDEQFPFEAGVGAAFHPEKAVSDFINLQIGTPVYAGSVAAYGVLDTFAIKNTLVAGADVGGRLTRTNAVADFDAAGISFGMKRHSFAMELNEAVTTPSVNTNVTVDGLSGSATPVVLPPSLDWRVKMPSCIPPVENQQSCSCCWAISSANSISSRICIAQGGEPAGKLLSIEQVVSCSTNLVTNTDGCHPQYPSTGFTYMTGDVTTRTCVPYSAFTAKAPGCQSHCQDGSNPPLAGGILAGSYSSLQTAADIKAALLVGPVAVGITIPTDFLHYFPVNSPTPESVIYPVSSSTTFMNPGGHMVLALGFDDTTTPKSWIIQNSWGDAQGNNGVIRLAQDTNNVLGGRIPWVDTHGYTALPRVDATDPVTVLLNNNPAVATSSNSLNSLTPGTQTRMYTATITCPNMILNNHQSNQSAAIQGCPNSAAVFMSTTTKSAAAALGPCNLLLYIVVLLALALTLGPN